MSNPFMPDGFEDLTADERKSYHAQLAELGAIDLPSTEKSDAEKSAESDAKRLNNAYRRMSEEADLQLVVDDLLSHGRYGECVFVVPASAELNAFEQGRQAEAIYLKAKIEEAKK